MIVAMTYARRDVTLRARPEPDDEHDEVQVYMQRFAQLAGMSVDAERFDIASAEVRFRFSDERRAATFVAAMRPLLQVGESQTAKGPRE